MIKPIEVEALPNYVIRIKFEDGVQGEIDLSDLVGKGVFKALQKSTKFQKVFISESGAISWGNEIELCADALYLKLTGKKPEELFPQIQKEMTDA